VIRLKKSKRINLRKQSFDSFKKNKEAQLLPVLRLYISVALYGFLQQETANFKLALPSGPMQWSALTEENQKNQLAQTKLRFIKKKIRRRNYFLSFASTSALHCSKRRQISRRPL
jgi:hypothetical protein